MDSQPVISPPSMANSASFHPNRYLFAGTNEGNDDAASLCGIGNDPKIRHSTYFFDDLPVIFEVEGVLFKVHKHYLRRDSEVFRMMFSCPSGADGAEGESEDRPIVLPDVTVQEFEALLDFFYEGMYPSSIRNAIPSIWDVPIPQPDPPRRSKKTKGDKLGPTKTDRLISLLSISTRFDFERVREHAIAALGFSGLSSLNPVEQAHLAKQYDVEEWLKPAYVQLCKRDEPLTIDEGHKLGLETSMLMAKAREAFIHEKLERESRPTVAKGWPAQCASPIAAMDPLDMEATRIINEVFFSNACFSV